MTPPLRCGLPRRAPQAKRRAKLKTKGKVSFQASVTQAHAERIRALMGDATYHAPAPYDTSGVSSIPCRKRTVRIFEARQAEMRDEQRARSLRRARGPRSGGGAVVMLTGKTNRGKHGD